MGRAFQARSADRLHVAPATQALRTGKIEVKSYAAIVPYNYTKCSAASNARQLITSYEVLGGAHSLSAIWASETWVKANPKTYRS